MKLNDKENEKIISYIGDNYNVFYKLFNKLNDYFMDNKKVIISKEEIKILNLIPIYEKYKLKSSNKIYRGLRLSDKKIKETIIKFKQQNKKLSYKPINEFSSWSLSKEVARVFVTRYGDSGLVFESLLNKKNEDEFINAYLLLLISKQLEIYMFNINKQLKNLKGLRLKVYNLVENLDGYLEDQEILVFGKLQVTNIYKFN